MQRPMVRLKAEARCRQNANEGNASKKQKRDGVESLAARSGRSEKPKSSRLMEVSVTVSVGGCDIDVALLASMHAFLERDTAAGLCALERGGTLFHLHFQMVMRLWTSSLVAANRKVKQYLGWDKVVPAGGMVLCRALKQRNMHTFEGMPSYCLKDQDQPYFQVVMHNIHADEINK
ncbi:hypothetical protein GOP47_0009836 [Adiantum capillus-veneris]|uniref:Replitron HUH endonuclease domain-containing protein n=1 Tax=Adiantum capillus-veneris TaxID=13818 RepID=A0A9D4ZK23_ADICA|nr:hypothetical protein GOP47_0009836 [Adiantum capillus-veneris]